MRRAPDQRATSSAARLVTAAISAAALLAPHLLRQLERTLAELHGQWWRTVTSRFVQDGVYGALSNLAFLLVLGIAPEQVTSRGRWLPAYFGAGWPASSSRTRDSRSGRAIRWPSAGWSAGWQ